MAKITLLLLPEELKNKYWKGLKIGDRFTYPRITRTTKFLSRNKKKALRDRSLFKPFSDYWKNLGIEEKQNWKEAGEEMGLTSWQLFIHDTAGRKKFDIEGIATPSLFHQGYVGNICIEEPADEIKIKQLHPKFYWIRQKVIGEKFIFEPVKITEDFQLPLKIKLNYSSDLVSLSENSFAKFYAQVWHSYQGVDYQTELKIDLDLQTGWKTAEAEMTNVIGQIIHYDLFFHLKGIKGNLYFDNIYSVHSSQNWARDSFCNEIEKIYPKVWFLIPKNWAGVIVPENTSYLSIYKDF